MTPRRQLETVLQKITDEIDGRIEHEQLQLADIRDKNSCGAGMCMGATDALRELKAFILEELEP